MAATEERRLDFTDHAREVASILSSPRWKVWSGPRDPELRKILNRIYTGMMQAQRLDEAGAFDDGARTRLLDLLDVDIAKLRLDTALEVVDRWDQLLIERGDADYLCTLLEVEYARVPAGTTVVTWKTLFGSRPIAASEKFRAGKDPTDEELEEARHRLAALFRARDVLYTLYRARIAMKAQYLLALAPVLLVVVALLALATFFTHPDSDWEEIVLGGTAGAVGATLAGTYKLRDHIEHINELRAFKPAMVVQPLLGAASGLFLLLILKSGIVSINDAGPEWATIGAVAFVAGFSEPFVLGVVHKIAAVAPAAPQGQVSTEKEDSSSRDGDAR